tara:strand:- start:97542 stop:98129 length:588 start_codon:yes stop_codon:yes gene_type:complete
MKTTNPSKPAARVARRRSRCANARGGFTFLESILAVVLLAMVAMTLSNASTIIVKAQRKMDQRLGAGELANRLILQYIDERSSLPDSSLPIEYDVDLYRWSLEESPVQFEFDNQETEESNAIGGGVSLDRIKLVTIKVWLDSDSGGSFAYSSTVPSIVLTRLIDPLAFNNPDSLETLLAKPGGIEEFLQPLLEGN